MWSLRRWECRLEGGSCAEMLGEIWDELSGMKLTKRRNICQKVSGKTAKSSLYVVATLDLFRGDTRNVTLLFCMKSFCVHVFTLVEQNLMR